MTSVLVAGGGVAGAAAACLLAQRGREVLLVERERGPHDKICGEFVSGEAVDALARLGIDVATRRVVHIPTPESTTANHVNRDLGIFHECVAATIARFPFYEEGEEERFQAAADELRELVTTLDDTALAHNGFWETLCDDVAMGDYANWGETKGRPPPGT